LHNNRQQQINNVQHLRHTPTTESAVCCVVDPSCIRQYMWCFLFVKWPGPRSRRCAHATSCSPISRETIPRNSFGPRYTAKSSRGWTQVPQWSWSCCIAPQTADANYAHRVVWNISPRSNFRTRTCGYWRGSGSNSRARSSSDSINYVLAQGHAPVDTTTFLRAPGNFGRRQKCKCLEYLHNNRQQQTNDVKTPTTRSAVRASGIPHTQTYVRQYVCMRLLRHPVNFLSSDILWHPVNVACFIHAWIATTPYAHGNECAR